MLRGISAIIIIQGKDREKSGNFKWRNLYEPCLQFKSLFEQRTYLRTSVELVLLVGFVFLQHLKSYSLSHYFFQRVQ